MNNENYHPVLKIPPNAHALHYYDEKTNTLTYEYNGINILKFRFPNNKVGFRHGSDGSMQSIQYLQQLYLEVEENMNVDMIVTLTDTVRNIKPKRARSNQPIFGQIGNCLINGINGIYDVNMDLMIDWNGCKWSFKHTNIIKKDNYSEIVVELHLTKKPVFINIRPYFYKNHLGYKYYEPYNYQPKQNPVVGWCSWEAYRRDIDISKIENISSFMSKHFKDYGMEYIQVDDGYQKMPLPYDPTKNMADGWMTCEDKKFPHGHKEIVDTIKKYNFKPAIWTNANITNPDFPKHNPHDVIWHENKALKGEWIDYLYSCSEENLKTQVLPIFEKYREKGYEYLKIDAIRHLCFDGLHECVRLGIMSNDEAERKYRRFLETTRKGLGDDIFYLASWGEMHEVVGLVDACRISMDSNPTWPGIRMQIFETARWYHAQRILFINDPDHVCVRTKADWAKSVLSLISLSGELCMLSDHTDAYTDEKIEIIQKTIPPLQTVTAEAGPLSVDYPAYTWTKLHGFAVQSNERPVSAADVELEDAINMSGEYEGLDDDHPFSTLWSFHISKANRNWCVCQRVATIPLRESVIKLENLGLDTSKRYHAFNFWDERYLGVVENEIHVNELQLGQCEVIAFFEDNDQPQVIASSRHVSMDAISIIKHEYNNKVLTLDLEGIQNKKIKYFLHVPTNLAIKKLSSNVEILYANNIVCLEVNFNNTKESVSIEFGGNYED